MIKSMTGYGKGEFVGDDATYSVEIKTVNHRYADVGVKLPRALMFMESELKKQVAQRLTRGKIDLFVSRETAAQTQLIPVVNEALAGEYAKLFRNMSAQFNLGSEIPLSLLAAQKDVIQLREADIDEEAVRGSLTQALSLAVDAVEKMRAQEGAALQLDLQQRVDAIEQMLKEIAARAPQVVLEWQQKLNIRIERLQDGIELDPQRLAQEVALVADRCDISEELVRFDSHLAQFRQLFSAEDAVGRQMDFLLQELNRETNTMGSKSNDAELTRQVVAIKAELEKIREQVQNIE
ncbi:MAG: YicC/YloC family endoribonuclease [Desulfuromonas sp.]|nr:YicC/YloC family endoribonuclease [Desulfuromonas sp.]